MLSIKQTRLVWINRCTRADGDWLSRPDNEDKEAVNNWLNGLEWILEFVYGQQKLITTHVSLHYNQFSVGCCSRTGYEFIARDCAKNGILRVVDCIIPCCSISQCSWTSTTKGQTIYDDMERHTWTLVKKAMLSSDDVVFDIGDCVPRTYEIMRDESNGEIQEESV